MGTPPPPPPPLPHHRTAMRRQPCHPCHLHASQVAAQLETFTALLAESGVVVSCERHFWDEEASLEAHFRVLTAFEALEGTSATTSSPPSSGGAAALGGPPPKEPPALCRMPAWLCTLI